MCNQEIWIVSIIIFILLIIFLQLPVKLLSWVLRKKYKIKLKVGSSGFLCFRNIQLQLRNGLKLEIESIGLSSRFINSSLKSAIVISVSDIRLQGDTEWLISRKKQTTIQKNGKEKSFQFLSKYLTLLKFLSLQISNASVMQLGKSDEEFLLHLSFQEFSLYFCRASKGVQINTSMLSSSVKVFKHQSLDKKEKRSTEACICHFSSNLHLTVVASVHKDISIQEFSLNISDPELMLYEGFSIIKFKNYALNGMQVKKMNQENPTEESSCESFSIQESNLNQNATTNQKSNSDAEMNLNQESNQKVDNIKNKLKKIPKVMDISVDLFSVKVMMKGGHRTYTFGIKFISVHFEVGEQLTDLPPIKSSLQVKEIFAASDHVQFGQLLNCALDISLSEKLVDAKFNLSMLHMLYEKEVLQYILGASVIKNEKVDNTPSIKRNQSFRDFLVGYKVRSCVGIDDVSVSFKIPECETFSFGLIKAQKTMEYFVSKPGVENNSTQFISSNSTLSLELLLETMYVKLGDVVFNEHAMLKKHHYEIIPFNIGVFLLKGRKTSVDCCLECMVDGCQLQWDPASSHLVLYIIKLMKRTPVVVVEGPKQEIPSKEKCSYSVELNFRGLNLFLVNELKTGVSVRADLLNLTYSEEKIKFLLEGSKLTYLNSAMKVYPCLRCSEVKTFDAFLEDFCVIYVIKKNEATVRLSEYVYIMWNTNLHMTLFTIAQEALAFKKSLGPKEITERFNDTNSSDSKDTTDKMSVYLQAKAHIDIGLILSKTHKMVFSAPDIIVKYNQHLISANSEQLMVVFDNKEVFTFEKILVSLMKANEQHLVLRQSFDDLELFNNRLLSIQFEAVRFVFPYKYNFAEAFSEQFINIIKWLKLLHKKKKVPFTLESKLPPDLHIACKVWSIEVEDDPFEVKLRDNFELLEDEYHENLKRKKMLDEKIENFKRTNLLLPNEKIKLLYSKLAKKSAEIYIQRSQQLYQKNPMRTSLCTWYFEDIDIIAIADTSYHGKERVVHWMKQLDPDSPYPEEGLEFTTLWARKVRCSATSWTWQIRDFPQMPLNIRELHLWGFLIGAEQEASKRAKRSSYVEINSPWENVEIERSMPSLKYYHDLTFDMEEMSMAYGPSWEPVVAQISLAMELVSRPSLDPSPALPWWDKMRLLYHGRLTWIAQRLNMFLRASLDPYNITEHMEISWSEVFIEWTNGKVLTKGDLDMYVHTASKYDDIRVLHIPHLKLSVSLDWLCLGNPYDHHNVVPCAPNKVPEYSINQVHDSYRAFRSQNLNISYSFETKHTNDPEVDIPTMLLYSSTFRWIENLKMILSGVTRLTRRGVLFSNTRPRKPQLSRHYHRLCVSLNLHKFKIIYWMSFAKQRGLELVGGRLSLSSENTQSLSNLNDGLKHRPRPVWNIGYLNSELSDSEIWLFNCMDEESENPTKSFDTDIERSYFLSVCRVSYGREEIVRDVVSEEDKVDTPTHRLVVYGLKGAWTRHNRLVIFSLLDSYQKTVVLKKNLSTEALRCFKGESQNTPQKIRTQTNTSQTCPSSGPSPISNLQSSHAVSMLQKLVAESEANSMVFIEEMEGTTREQQLYGVSACETDDVLQKKWLIELVNSQVMLRGCETSGYVIVSAAKAKLLQKLHSPVWKNRSLVSKTTWVGSFECMQYYATVDAGVPSRLVDDVMWLSVDNIEERESMIISDLPDLVGSGHSVGGVVSSTVGATSDPEFAPIQLQRIVSRCGCQFYYASFGENVDPCNLEEVPPLPEDNDLWEQEIAVDCFTLTHHDLDICTNSLQYAMILDLVNNLLLYVEPRKKEATNRLQYMRFQLQLCSVEDQREPISQLQEKLRSLLSNLRRLEKEAYVCHKFFIENPDRTDYLDQLHMLDNQIYEHKELLNSMNEELTMMISCFKEAQIIATRSRQRASSHDKGVSATRRSEVCFKHAQWRLTDADGQLGISDLILSNFLYSKVAKSDDSVEHLLELGYVKMCNLLPNQAYKVVLQPTEMQSKIPLDRQCLLRIYCREKAPVGGISIKEHLEVNLVPITIGLTEALYKAMLKFFFPGRDTEKGEDHSEDEESSSAPNRKPFKQKRSATFYGERDDIEKMKERADKNHTFFSIKIPEVPLRVSYKGKKEKNIEDVHELSLLLSTIEYHNKCWTWLDLLMALKNDAKKILLSQAIKQKLLKSRNIPEADTQPQEDEKAMILLGTQHLVSGDRTLKKGLLSRIRKDHH